MPLLVYHAWLTHTLANCSPFILRQDPWRLVWLSRKDSWQSRPTYTGWVKVTVTWRGWRVADIDRMSNGCWPTKAKDEFNTLRLKQNGRHFPDDIFECIFLKENVWNSIKISLKFVSKGSINNIPALVQIMAWRRPGDKTLSEPMMVSLLTHICHLASMN